MKICTGVQEILRFSLRNLRDCKVGITDVMNIWCVPLFWLRLHDIHIKFHDNRFRHLNNTTVITAKIWETVILALLIEGIYELCPWNGFVNHDIRTKFRKYWCSLSRNIKVLLQKSMRLQCWYYWCEVFMNYAVEISLSAPICASGLINIAWEIQNLLVGVTHIDTKHRQQGDLIRTHFYFFK
jgi:hypothetical protein